MRMRISRSNAPEVGGPQSTIRDGALLDITAKTAPTVAAILDQDHPARYVQAAPGKPLGSLDAIAANPVGDLHKLHLLAPCDLHVIKAAGVTFAKSMVERVIEERAAGEVMAFRNREGRSRKRSPKGS